MIDPIMVTPHVRPLLAAAAIGALVCACGGGKQSADTSTTPDSSSDTSGSGDGDATDTTDSGGDSGDKVTLAIATDRSTNGGRPFRVVVRAIDYKTYLEDTYAGIAAMVMTPDDSVQAMEVIHPGHDTRVEVAKPEQDSLAIYFLFTNPSASWKTYLDKPVSTKLALDTDGVGDPETLPPTATPESGDTQTADGSDGKKNGLPTRKKVALVSGGAGGVALIAGTVFGLVAESKFNESGTYCNAANQCTDQAGVDLGTQAQNYGWAANISWAVGAVGVAVGAALWFTTPSDKESASSTALQIRPLLGPRESGVTVQVRF